MNLSTNPHIITIVTKHALWNKTYNLQSHIVKKKMNNIVRGIKQYNYHRDNYGVEERKENINRQIAGRREYWTDRGVTMEELNKQKILDYWKLYLEYYKLHALDEYKYALELLKGRIKWRKDMKKHIEKMYYYLENEKARKNSKEHRSLQACKKSLRRTIDKDQENNEKYINCKLRKNNPFLSSYMFMDTQSGFLNAESRRGTRSLRPQKKILECIDRLIREDEMNRHFLLIKYAEEMFLKKQARKIETWFLECKYNPKYKYCQKWLDDEYDNY
jgi:hypothetical protein